MNCERVQVMLLEYSRRLLNPSETEVVRTHLAICQDCRTLLKQEMRLANQLSEIPFEEPKTDVWRIVQSRMETGQRASSLWKIVRLGYMRKAAVAAVAAGVLFAGVFFALPSFHTSSEEERVAEAAQLIQVQPINQRTLAFTDDPLATTTDAMMQALEDVD